MYFVYDLSNNNNNNNKDHKTGVMPQEQWTGHVWTYLFMYLNSIRTSKTSKIEDATGQLANVAEIERWQRSAWKNCIRDCYAW